MNDDNEQAESSFIYFADFKEKYKSDIWHKYEAESNKYIKTQEKIDYWKTKINKYQKDRLKLDPSPNVILLVAIDTELRKPKNITGLNFESFSERQIEILKIDLSEEENNQSKDYKKQQWFKIGLIIAKGELEALIKKHGSIRKVAEYLNINHSYISDSRLNIESITRNTNIYNNDLKIKKIYNYCIKSNIKMTDLFIESYNKIELK